jgi:hypothetical protein
MNVSRCEVCGVVHANNGAHVLGDAYEKNFQSLTTDEIEEKIDFVKLDRKISSTHMQSHMIYAETMHSLADTMEILARRLNTEIAGIRNELGVTSDPRVMDVFPINLKTMTRDVDQTVQDVKTLTGLTVRYIDSASELYYLKQRRLSKKFIEGRSD